jgi:filamentous hemagglutinin family protein
VIPDSTLGPESSVVIDIDPSTQIIEGGATRGSNLFHSFLEFNIAPGSALYFNPDSGISDILTRITGPNPSAIEGLLGVNGSANLYLLNPNGILFGPNASLDVTGSFHAIAAPYLPLGNGIFSATAPQSSSLLSISPDVSLFNYLTSGDITSSAALSTGQALTLAGNNLQLSNQLQAGSDLTLLASDTVTIRDSADTAFLARSGDDLTVQGTNSIDILALQHLDLTPFVSGQDLTFISDGFISTDAHFESGGNLQFLTLSGAPGNLLSLYDPIISANGDVVFGNYIGAALKIEATGSIQGGNIGITTPDTTLTPDGSGSDQDLLASSRAVILRAGLTSVGSSNIPQATGGTIFSSGVILGHPPGSIVVDGIDTSTFAPGLAPGSDGGPIILEATGDITSNLLWSLAFAADNAGDGGRVELVAGGNITSDVIVSSSSSSTGYAGNGGRVELVAGGNITSGVIASSSRSSTENASDGGNVELLAGGSIEVGSIDSYSFSDSGNSGNSGSINLSAGGRVSAFTLQSYSLSNAGNSAAGGDISVISGDNVTVGRFNSYSSSAIGLAGDGGRIQVVASGNVSSIEFESFSSSTAGNSSNGGEIYITAGDNITSLYGWNSSSSSDSGNSGNGGEISLISGSDVDSYFDLESSSSSDFGNAGDGGGITIIAGGNITPRNLRSYAYSRFGSVGNGGNIFLESQGDILTGNLASYSQAFLGSGESADGGSVQLLAAGDIIIEYLPVLGSVSTVSYSRSNSAGDGGEISFLAGGDVIVATSFYSSSSSISGDTGDGGDIEVIAGGNIISDFRSGSFSISGNAGDGGSILISAGGDIISNTLQSLSFSGTENASNAGNIQLISGGRIQPEPNLYPQPLSVDALAITTGNATRVSGTGGNVLIQAGNSVVGLRAITIASDNNSGNISIEGFSNLLLLDMDVTSSAQVEIDNFTGVGTGGSLVIDVFGFGQSGNARISAPGNLTIENTSILSDANGSVSGGQILIENANNVTLNNSQLLSDTNANGVGGDIILRNLGSLTLNNSTFTTDTAGATPTSDAGNIVIDNVGVFLMRNNSLVRVNAENGANAGDINIATDFIVGVPGENNDIIANAVGGNGGRIFATATGIYGFTERNGFTFSELRNLSTNDISASSLFARDGEVSLTFEETPSAEDLPSDFLDSDSLISNSCITPNNQVAGSFTIPGAGGLPATPADVTTSNYSTGDVQTLPTPQSNADDDGWQLGDPIVEPDAVTQLADGRIVFGRRCEQPWQQR